MEKIKNLPVFRMLAFALTVAIVLGLSAVMLSFTASAEDVSSDRVTLEDGTLVPTINGFSIIGSKSVTNIMISYIRETYGDGLIFLIAQDKTTKDIYYSRYPQAYLHDKEYMYCYFPSGYDCTAPFVTSDTSAYDYFYIDDTYTAHHEGYGKSYKPSFYNAAAVAVSPNLSNLNYYWCYTNSIKWDKMNACSLSAIVGKSDNSGFKEGVKAPPSGGSENGRFICFGDYKDYSYDEHLVDISNGCIHQLKDYDTKVKSYYTSFMFDSDDVAYSWVNKRADENKIKTYKAKAIAFRFYNPDDSISSVRLRISRTMIMPTTRESNNPFDVPAFVTFHPANKHYSRYVVLSEGSLSSVPAKSTITARVDLQAYCDLYGNSTYLLELVNGKSNEVVSSVLMSYTGKDYDRFDNSGVNDANAGYIDVKYQLDKGNTVDNDVLIPDSDGVLPSLPNGVDDDTFKPSGNYDLSKVDITDIFATLNQSTASVGAFFQACFNILPATLVALILGSLALLIVLRVLGR